MSTQPSIANGKADRGFLDPQTASNQPYETKLICLAYLERLEQATTRKLSDQTGLTHSQVAACIGRCLKAKGEKLIYEAGTTTNFPTGKSQVYALTDAGRQWLDLARSYGYLRRDDDATD